MSRIMDPDRIFPSFAIRTPRDIVFGRGKSALLAGYLPPSVKRVLIVSGRHAADGAAKTVAGALDATGRATRIFAETMAEPSPGAVDAATAAVRAWNADAVVAIGGGSVIDTAKAAAALTRQDGPCIEYFNGTRELVVTDRPFFAALPVISVPSKVTALTRSFRRWKPLCRRKERITRARSRRPPRAGCTAR